MWNQMVLWFVYKVFVQNSKDSVSTVLLTTECAIKQPTQKLWSYVVALDNIAQKKGVWIFLSKHAGIGKILLQIPIIIFNNIHLYIFQKYLHLFVRKINKVS